MNTAIVAGVEVEAWAGAPQRGKCPACGGQVALWNHPRGGCYYRHLAGEGKGCPRRTHSDLRVTSNLDAESAVCVVGV